MRQSCEWSSERSNCHSDVVAILCSTRSNPRDSHGHSAALHSLGMTTPDRRFPRRSAPRNDSLMIKTNPGGSKPPPYSFAITFLIIIDRRRYDVAFYGLYLRAAPFRDGHGGIRCRGAKILPETISPICFFHFLRFLRKTAPRFS